MPQVIVIGGGVSGLATACFLKARGLQPLVLEAAARPGGHVHSLREGGRVIDAAANGWLDNEPAMHRLLALAGLTERVVRASPASKRRWIWSAGQMHAAPLSPPALLATRLLGPLDKLRLAWEPFVPPAPPGQEETVGDFARRRLGRAALDKLVAPMVAGITAGDADAISLQAAFPRMVELEREHGSLVRAAWRLGRGGAPSGHLCTLSGGAGALPEGLAAHLGEGALRTGAAARGLAEVEGGWEVRLDGEVLRAPAVVLACPAAAQAALVRPFDPELAATLEAIPYAPVAVVATAWGVGARARRVQGFGVLKARGEDLDGVLGVLFTHEVFPDQAPEGEVLLRAILGGAPHPEVAALGDQALLERTRRALSALLGPELEPPRSARVFRHPQGIPQYTTGHPGRVAAIRRAEGRHHGLVLVGNHLEGVAVKDCARAGERAAERVAAQIEL